MNEKIFQRLQGLVRTVTAWEDESMLLQCRQSFPAALFEARSELEFLQELVNHVRGSMTWVNQPPCDKCQGETKYRTTRGPETHVEKTGQANRVEVYECNTCQSVTFFPRFNATHAIFASRRGRCGEYANLMGQYCRSAGLETRYVWDSTDHVWVEVFLDDDWIMVDVCEGVIDEPSMYQVGWGKKSMSCVLAVAFDHVVDVTSRYVRPWNADRDDDGIEEAVRLRHRQQLDASGMTPRAKEELTRRLQREAMQLNDYRQQGKWLSTYRSGRISGSMAWKLSRSEAGGCSSERADSVHPVGFEHETFYPHKNTFTLSVEANPKTAKEAIKVSGVACSVGAPGSLSVVVVDTHGAILQSRSLSSCEELEAFVETVPHYRIICIHGQLPGEKACQSSTMKRLPGFDTSWTASGVLFIGQVAWKPDWTCGGTFESCSSGLHLAAGFLAPRSFGWKTLDGVVPASVAGRLPENVMPLATQLMASLDQKRAAFASFAATDASSGVFGFSTKEGGPVYLLDETAYPVHSLAYSTGEWHTCLMFPSAMAPEGLVEDVGPEWSIPVDVSFFQQQLGDQLLKQAHGTPMPTSSVLENARLIGLYFSAHW